MDPPYDSQPRPALARLRSLALTALAAAAFWVVALAMATAYVFIERENLVYTVDMVPGSVLSVLFGVVLFIALRAMLLRVAHLPFWRQAAIAAILVLAFAAPYEYVFRALQSVVLPQDDVRLLPLNLRVLVPATVFWTPPFGVWAVGVLALTHETNARRREQWLAEARAQAHQAQVRALRYQVNPHFLYNTLNSIAALILDKRGETAETMVIRLSRLLPLQPRPGPAQRHDPGRRDRPATPLSRHRGGPLLRPARGRGRPAGRAGGRPGSQPDPSAAGGERPQARPSRARRAHAPGHQGPPVGRRALHRGGR